MFAYKRWSRAHKLAGRVAPVSQMEQVQVHFLQKHARTWTIDLGNSPPPAIPVLKRRDHPCNVFAYFGFSSLFKQCISPVITVVCQALRIFLCRTFQLRQKSLTCPQTRRRWLLRMPKRRTSVSVASTPNRPCFSYLVAILPPAALVQLRRCLLKVLDPLRKSYV